MADLSIVIPARNEESNIVKTIERLREFIECDFEIVVVNDHSVDKTKEAAEALAIKYRNIRVIDNEDESGFSRALLVGIKSIRTAFFVPVMADLCDDPITINDMYKKIIDGYDIVVGSRYMSGGRRVGGAPVKAFFSNFMGKSLHFFTAIPTRDIPNAFKMYRKAALDNIQIESQGFEISVELPLKAYFNGAKITEVPTVWQERKVGRSHFKLFSMGRRYIPLYVWAVLKGVKFRACRFFQ